MTAQHSAAVCVRLAGVRDLPYILNLARMESEAIGFIPSPRYESTVTKAGRDARRNHSLWIAEANGDPVGFLYASPGISGGSLKIVQVCVQVDARRLEFGAALVDVAEQHAMSIQRSGISLAVAADLDASAFWAAEGYELLQVDRGGARRVRLLERRYKRLSCGLFTEIPS